MSEYCRRTDVLTTHAALSTRTQVMTTALTTHDALSTRTQVLRCTLYSSYIYD